MKHFPESILTIRRRNTTPGIRFYSREGKISCRDIARMMEQAGFTVTESRQIQGMIYTVTGRKGV